MLHTELGAPAEAHFGAPALDFHRADLHRVLVDALPEGTIRLGTRVTSVEQDADGAMLVVADGSRIRADAVVAADGIKSPIRQQLVGTDAPEFSGTVVYRGLLSRERALDLHPDRINRYWLGPHRHGVVYWISAGSTLAVNTAVQHAEWAEESWTAEATTDELLAYFDGWDPSLLERIRRCSTLLRGAVFVRRPLDDWAFGRIALLGDAAHAMEPWQAQGAAQAIEDAYVLAECLADSHGEVDAALEAVRDDPHDSSDRAPALVGAGGQRLLSSGRRGAAPARRRSTPRCTSASPSGTGRSCGSTTFGAR